MLTCGNGLVERGESTVKTAGQIMQKKAGIKAELDRQLPADQSDRIWRLAAKKLDQILQQYADIPEGEHMHTDRLIFPAAAIYLTAKAHMPAEQAYAVIENAAVAQTAAIGKKLAKLMKLPFMPDLFVKAWDPMTKKMFGKSCGFENRFYPKKKGEYRMDILACPYHKYFTLLGCPELTKIFCDNDERTYGDLPGLRFVRKNTLGNGGSCCDFYIRRIK